MSISFQDLFGDKEVKETTGSKFKSLNPEVTTLPDGKLEIADFIRGVNLDSIAFDAEKNQAVITFSKDGATRRKYISEPESRSYIVSEPDEFKKKEDIKKVYFEIQRLVSNYVYNNTVLKTIKDLGAFTFGSYVEGLGKLIESGDSRTNNEILLKVTFKDTTGLEPDFVIPNYSYIGQEGQWGPKWSKDNVKSNDSKGYGFTQFEVVEKTPDFGSDINSVFTTSSIDMDLI